jgi:hypothetical protein
MAARDDDVRTVLEHELRRRDWTYEEASRRFDKAAKGIEGCEKATLGPHHIGRLARGERTNTMAVTRRVLQEMFGRPLEELLKPWIPHDGARDLVLPMPGQGLPSTGAERQLILMAAERARRFNLFSQAALPPESLEQVYDDVRKLATDYPRRPLTDVLPDLVRAQDDVYALLEQTHRPQQGRQLYMLAGIIGGMLAKASHDMAEPHAAITQARAAFSCAENADHNGLRAWLRGLQALVAYWAGRPGESVKYAQDGAQYALVGSGTASVWLPISEARAWAAQGNVIEARAAIERAEDARDHVTMDELDELGGLCSFSVPRQLYYAADALAWLPSEADATALYATQAIEAYSDHEHPDWAFGDQAGSRTDLAIARVVQGEIEGAAESLAPVLDLPVPQRINGVMHSVRRVRDALRNSPDVAAPEVREVQDQIEMFARTPAMALPR